MQPEVREDNSNGCFLGLQPVILVSPIPARFAETTVELPSARALRARLSLGWPVFPACPACQLTKPPATVGRDTMFSRRDLSLNATVLDVAGHQHASGFARVLSLARWGQATHCFDVPLQQARDERHMSPRPQHVLWPKRSLPYGMKSSSARILGPV